MGFRSEPLFGRDPRPPGPRTRADHQPTATTASGHLSRTGRSPGHHIFSRPCRRGDHSAAAGNATARHTVTGDAHTGRLLGAQLVGHRGAEIAKRIDILAGALFHDMTVDAVSDLDLSYTSPLGSPWDAVQVATQTWTATHRTAPTRPPDPDRASPPPAATTGSAEPVADARSGSAA